MHKQATMARRVLLAAYLFSAYLAAAPPTLAQYPPQDDDDWPHPDYIGPQVQA